MTRRRGFLLFVADHQSPAKLRQLSLVPLAHAQLLGADAEAAVMAVYSTRGRGRPLAS
jgi:hypothetical protein